MKIVDRLADAWTALRGRSAPPAYGGGAVMMGGPYHQDAYHAKRAPTPFEIIEAYKSIIFFCANLNADRLCALPLRMYAMSGSGMPKPRSACGPRPITRASEQRLRSLPWLSRSVAGSEDIQEVTTHPFLDLLDNPVPDELGGDLDRHQFLNLLCRFIDIVGTAYAKPVGNGEFLAELWPLQSQYVLPQRRTNTAVIDEYVYFTERYPARDVFRARLRPSLHDLYGSGYAAAQAAVQYAGLEDQWVSIQGGLLGAGPRFGMIVSPSDPHMPLGKDEGEKLEREMNTKYARGGANRVWVNRTGLRVDQTTYPPESLAGLDISKYNLERIANCFGVPPAYLSDSANLANTQAAKELHATNAIEPRADAIGSALSRLLRRYSGDRRLFVAFDPAVGEDEERTARIVDMRIKNGLTTINEARAECGEPPVEWGDEPWFPQTLIQPTAAAQAREHAQETATAGIEAKASADAEAEAKAKDGPPARSWRKVDAILEKVDADLDRRAGAGAGTGDPRAVDDDPWPDDDPS